MCFGSAAATGARDGQTAAELTPGLRGWLCQALQQSPYFDVETDLKIRYGWTLPVTSLRYWALGIPDPATTSVLEFGDDGLPSVILQRGWTVKFNEYREGGGQSMPRRISAVGEEARKEGSATSCPPT